MPQVVLVEDDAAIRAALVRTLREQGHGVRSVVNGLEAIAAVMETRPDVVVLDLGLPDLDGAEALTMIRGVTAVPGYDLHRARRRAWRSSKGCPSAGANDYVVKPVPRPDLTPGSSRAAPAGRPRPCPPWCGSAAYHRCDRRPRPTRRRPLDLSRQEFDLLPSSPPARPGGDETGDARRGLATGVRRSRPDPSTSTCPGSAELGETAAEPRYLHTVRGVGVRLSAPEPLPTAGT